MTMITILKSAGIGIIVLLAGSLPWGVLGSLNLRQRTTVPWAILPMTLYLLVYWSIISGRRGDPATSAKRAQYLRANGLAPQLWAGALGAGLLGFGALIGLLAVTARLLHLPAGFPISTPAGTPAITVALLLLMQSIVAGVSEEAAFRGYMQGPIEKRFGLATAILAQATLFGLLHFPNHPGADTLVMLPYYVAVSAVYGGLTWATNSILPALALHSAGDAVVLLRWWITGRPEWQLALAPPSLVWESGVDASAVLAAILAIALSLATAAALAKLRRVRCGDEPGPS